MAYPYAYESRYESECGVDGATYTLRDKHLEIMFEDGHAVEMSADQIVVKGMQVTIKGQGDNIVIDIDNMRGWVSCVDYSEEGRKAKFYAVPRYIVGTEAAKKLRISE